MKNKIDITNGTLSMSFPTSSLLLIYAKSNEIIAYFKAVNDKTIRVVLDMDELKTKEMFKSLDINTMSCWVFDEMCERYGEIRVKKIDILNSIGSPTSL